jgi:hypothetical protein
MPVTKDVYDFATASPQSEIPSLVGDYQPTKNWSLANSVHSFMNRCQDTATVSAGCSLSTIPQESTARTNRLKELGDAYTQLKSSITKEQRDTQDDDQELVYGLMLDEIKSLYEITRKCEECDPEFFHTFKMSALDTLAKKWENVSENHYDPRIQRELTRFVKHASLMNGSAVNRVRTGFGHCYETIDYPEAPKLLDWSNTALQTSFDRHASYLKSDKAWKSTSSGVAETVSTLKELNDFTRGVTEVTRAQYDAQRYDPGIEPSQHKDKMVYVGEAEYFDMREAHHKFVPVKRV